MVRFVPRADVRIPGGSMADLIVEVSGPYILIRAPKGSFKATYKNSPDSHQLVLESEWFSNGREKPIRLAHFRARAWRLANDIATELGWF